MGTFLATAPPGYFAGLAAVRRQPLRAVLFPALAAVVVLMYIVVIVLVRVRARRSAARS